jgi:DNA-binding NarL/FixJ family response regulator
MPPFRIIGITGIVNALISILLIALENAPLFYDAILFAVCLALVVAISLTAPAINGLYQHAKQFTMKENDQMMLIGEVPFTHGILGSEVLDCIRKRCLTLGSYYKLTPREIDVLTSIAQGRSHVRIQEELMISESTVKTHTANIFTKLNVHSRQEVIDLVFEE